MSLSNVNIIKSDGNIVSNPLNLDGVSGLIFFTDETFVGASGSKYKLLDASSISTVFADGTIEAYHLNEYFSKSTYPLYVSVYSTSPSTNITEVMDLIRFSEGEIRQVGIHNGLTTFATSTITKLQAQAVVGDSEYTPFQMVYSAKFTGTVENFSTSGIANITTLASPNVSYTIGQDNNGTIFTTFNGVKHIGNIGKVLGLLSSASVHENIGWVAKFNCADTVTVPGFTDGSLISAKTKAFLDNLDNFALLFYRKFNGITGVYVNYDYTAEDATTSDFAYQTIGRTYQKAFRNLRGAYLPSVNSPVYVDKSGKLSNGAIQFFKGLGAKQLQIMKDAGEISDFSIEIDSNQKVLVTKQLDVVAKIVPVGVSKVISIKLGFALSI